MQPLTRVSHEHHDLLWRYVNQLHDLADCLDCDCFDSGGLSLGCRSCARPTTGSHGA